MRPAVARSEGSMAAPSGPQRAGRARIRLRYMGCCSEVLDRGVTAVRIKA